MTSLLESRGARGALALLALPALALLGGASSATPLATGPAPSPTVEECEEDAAPGWSARVRPGAKQPEPPFYAAKNAKRYRTIKDSPYLGDGSVTVETVFHVVTDDEPTPTERARLEQQVADQMGVLNASFAGETSHGSESGGGSDTPFRFDLTETTWTVDEEWATLTPGPEETAMKRALHQGDAETLNVYVTGLEQGLLGFAYFAKDRTPSRAYLDGVVILDGTLPDGYAGRYAEGDTLVHETGHWLALMHTFEGGCGEKNDFVADTPRQAEPLFGCPEGADTCAAPGLDPVANFMGYTDDECMDEFTPGQAERMSDAWVAYRSSDG